MQVFHYDIPAYCDLEKDLCSLHAVPEEFEGFADEWREIQAAFRSAFRAIPESGYELPKRRHNIRMLWVYLYSDLFYTSEFIAKIQRILAGTRETWFAQFECYSPSLESPLRPTGVIGEFLVYKTSVVFCDNEQWKKIAPKLGV